MTCPAPVPLSILPNGSRWFIGMLSGATLTAAAQEAGRSGHRPARHRGSMAAAQLLLRPSAAQMWLCGLGLGAQMCPCPGCVGPPKASLPPAQRPPAAQSNWGLYMQACWRATRGDISQALEGEQCPCSSAVRHASGRPSHGVAHAEVDSRPAAGSQRAHPSNGSTVLLVPLEATP